MSKTSRRLTVLSLVLLDAMCVALALAAAYWLRIGSGLLPDRAFEEFAVYERVSLLVVPVWLVIFAFHHLYDLRHSLSGLEEYIQIAKSCTYGIVAVILIGYWVRIAVLSRGWLIFLWLFGVVLVGGGRFVFRRVVYGLRRRGHFRIRTLIVGANEQGRAIAQQFLAANSAGMDIVGFVDDFLPYGALVSLDGGRRNQRELRVLGSPDRLRDIIREHQVSNVVVVSNAVAWETFQEILQGASLNGEAADFEIKLSPGFYEILTTGVRVTHEAFVPLLLIDRQRITGMDAVLKAALDYSLALVNMVVALPLMGLTAMALRLTTSGPVLERHMVLACGGGSFTTWKFRTALGDTPRPLFAHPLSHTLAPAGGGVQVSTAAPARVTWLQRFLYDTGLDKMPQLFNILRGDMSWVGPRTVSVGHVDVHWPWLPNLLTVKPGVTGPWAVGGSRSLEAEMRLTMYYIRNWTIWLDLQILLQTAVRVLRLERSKAKLRER